jgi:hypothetical protein
MAGNLRATRLDGDDVARRGDAAAADEVADEITSKGVTVQFAGSCNSPIRVYSSTVRGESNERSWLCVS